MVAAGPADTQLLFLSVRSLYGSKTELMHDTLRIRISEPGHVVHTCSPSTREAKAGFMSLKQARLHSYNLSLWVKTVLISLKTGLNSPGCLWRSLCRPGWSPSASQGSDWRCMPPHLVRLFSMIQVPSFIQSLNRVILRSTLQAY